MKMKKYLIFTLLLLISAATQAQNNGQYPKDGSLRLTIHYLYVADSSTAAHRYVNDTLSEGVFYSVPSPVVEGYLPDRDTVSGRMPATNLTDTVFYRSMAFSVSIDTNITHGTVTASPEGEIAVGTEVTLTVLPEEHYQLESLQAFKVDDETQTVEIVDNVFAMPAFNVMVTASFTAQLPVIVGDIETPPTICSGNALELVAPEVSNADEQGWQLAATSDFESPIAYTGQELDASYSGWKLRYYASNTVGTVYSNVVRITVTTLEPVLSGDLNLCTRQTGTYTATGVGNADLTWTVSDAQAVLVETGKTVKVTWATAGQHTVTLTAENDETGCSATQTLSVTVISYVNSTDVHDIVAKQNNGKDYILIYPNPADNYKYQWFKDGSPIAGANGQYYYQSGGLENGVYKVYISFNADANGNLFGGAFTNEYTVTTNAEPSLSPNPATSGNDILVTNPTNEPISLTIYSLDGRLLHQQTINGSQALLNVHLAQGMYMVRTIDSQNNETTQKLIVR